MIITASILPQPPDGYVLPRRSYDGQDYIVTGWFPKDRQNDNEHSLYRAPALVFDFDLVDFFIYYKGLAPAAEQQYKQFAKQTKKKLYALPVDEVRRIWLLFQTALYKKLMKLGRLPTIATISGWGVHALYWLPEDAGYKNDNECSFTQARALNKIAVQAINIDAGYPAADPGVHDCGTRLLREIGSRNTKAGRSIKVRRLDALSTGRPLDLEDLDAFRNNVCLAVATQSQEQAKQQSISQHKPKPKRTFSSSSYKKERLDFTSIKVSTGSGIYNLQQLADQQSPGQKINIVCPFGGQSLGGAFVVGAASKAEQKLVSNNSSTVYTNEAGPGVADLDTHSRTGRTLGSWLNCYKILMADTRLPRLWFDAFRFRRMIGKEKLEDKHYRKLKLQLVQLYGITFASTTLKDVVKLVCEENTINPLTDWLKSLTYNPNDKSLIEEWLIQVTGCDDTPLFRAYARCFLIACVARAMQPGCKVDNVLILQGAQGIQKSTLFKVLAGSDFFSDTYINIGKKDAYQQLHNAWIYEMAELDSFYRKDASQIKSFLTSTQDEFRPPYAEELQTVPRHTVIVGTTNEAAPLKDDTGNRRFWLVPCPPVKFNLQWLARHRTQLWAEAMHYYNQDVPWWLTPEEEATQEEFNSGFIPGNSAEHFLLWWLKTQLAGVDSVIFRAGDVISAFSDCEGKQIQRPPSAKVLAQMLLAQEGMSKQKTCGIMQYSFSPPKDWEGLNVEEPHPLKRARLAEATTPTQYKGYN